MKHEEDVSGWHKDVPCWMKDILDQQMPRWRDMSPPNFQNSAIALIACLLARQTNNPHLETQE